MDEPMKKNEKSSHYSISERLSLLIFVISSGLYILNVLIGKAAIHWGWEVFHLGNVGEMLILLIASISVIAAALHREAAEDSKQETNQQ
jgi:hypothetical protein